MTSRSFYTKFGTRSKDRPSFIQRAVEILKKTHPTTRFELVIFTWQNTKYHPNVAEQEIMAKILEKEIRRIMNW